MKKIILVAYDLNPCLGSEAGKANLWLQVISKHYFVEVFTNEKHKQDILKEKYQNVNFNFVRLGSLAYRFLENVKLYNLMNLMFIKKIKPKIKSMISNASNGKYELIHCITPAGIHAYNDLYKLGMPIIAGPIGGGLKTPANFEQIFRKQKLLNFARDEYYNLLIKNKRWREYFCNAKKIIIGTAYLKELLPEECHKNTVIIFDTLVDPLKFKVINVKRGRNISICFSGRMEPQKGCELLLKSFIGIAKKYDNVNLDFVGDGSSLSGLKKIVRNLNLNKRVRFLGQIPRDKILEVLNQSDIFCLPTLREPGGVAIIEAMACELPVVTTNYGGPAYSVTHDCGIKIEPTNYDDYVKNLEKALAYLIEHKKERIRMGKNGRKRTIAEFSPKIIEKKIVALYREIMSN
jgi:glycosyltransferase involved in cell wall biosynthesis